MSIGTWRRMTSYLVLAVALSILAVSGAIADNILANPGFEDGLTYYSGVGTGGGNSWNYYMIGGDNAIRSETKYYGGTAHSGEEAVRFRTSYGGGCWIYQDIDVVAGGQYTASVWVRTYSDGAGFGVDTSDYAGIIVQQLDASGNYIDTIGQAMINTANSDYQLVTVPAFTVGESTGKIRFILATYTASDYQHGYVSFDDCSLDGPPVTAKLSGTVTSDGEPVAGATVTVQGKSVTTAADGTYTISNLISQSCSVNCTADNCWPWTSVANLVTGDNTFNIEIITKPTNNLLSNPGFEDGVVEYSGTDGGGGLGWKYQQEYGNNAIRPETYYAGDTFSPSFHSGSQAIRFRTSDGGASQIYQDIPVLPDTDYKASAWVRTYSNGNGFGVDSNDKAGIWLQELDASGAVIADLGEEYISVANDTYQYVSKKIHTSTDVKKLRFILHSVTTSNWQTGAVSYDDCVLEGPSIISDLTGTVTNNDGTPVEGAVVSAQGKTATTGADGSYSIINLNSGLCVVKCTFDGYWVDSSEIMLEIGPNTHDIVLAPLAKNNLLTNPGFEDGVARNTAGGYGWTYQVISGSVTFRPESDFTGLDPDLLPYTHEYHSGVQAIRLRPDYACESIIYQDVCANANTDYTASAWVRGYNGTEGGFGFDTNDKAGVWVKGLDINGNEVADYGEAVITSGNTGYQYVSKKLKTGANVAMLRFALHTVIAADLSTGAVAFDDCALDGPAGQATIHGTVVGDGENVANATVTALGQTTTTDANGEFNLSGAVSGPITVSCTADGYWPYTKTFSLGSGVNNITLTLISKGKSNLLVNPGFEEGALIFNSGNTASGYGWNYNITNIGDSLRPESYYTNDSILPYAKYHDGNEAIRFRGSSYGSAEVYQDALIVPGEKYLAAAWVRTFGPFVAESDKAGVIIRQFDANDNQIGEDLTAFVPEGTNGDYQYVSLSFTADPQASKVQYCLRTDLAAAFDSGFVCYDDCLLDGPGVESTLTGTVTSNGVAVPNATVTIQGKDGVTDSNGVYNIAGLNAKPSCPGVCAADDFYSEKFRIDLAPGANTHDITLAPAPKNNLLVNPGFEDGALDYNSGNHASGNGWNYDISTTGDAVRGENFYIADGILPCAQYHNGNNAIRFRGSVNGTADIYQDVNVLPQKPYTASAWVRTYGPFDVNADGKAGIVVQQFDASGNAIGTDLTNFVASATDGNYVYVAIPFTTDAQTNTVRFCLHSKLTADFFSAFVSYDDCALDGPSVITYKDVAKISDLKDDGDPIAISDKVVTASFDGFFYIEEQNRSAGIKVTGSAAVGSVVRVLGIVKTINGERTIVSDDVESTHGGTVPRPLGLNNRATGQGLSATGLYVICWGSVKSVDATNGFFTMTDGSGDALKVYGSAAAGDYVMVTGALGAEQNGGSVVPVVHAVTTKKLN